MSWRQPLLGESAHPRTGHMALLTATTARSDFSSPCIIGVGSPPSRCGSPTTIVTGGQAGCLPVPVQGAVRACQGLRPRRVVQVLAITRPCGNSPTSTVIARAIAGLQHQPRAVPTPSGQFWVGANTDASETTLRSPMRLPHVTCC